MHTIQRIQRGVWVQIHSALTASIWMFAWFGMRASRLWIEAITSCRTTSICDAHMSFRVHAFFFRRRAQHAKFLRRRRSHRGIRRLCSVLIYSQHSARTWLRQLHSHDISKNVTRRTTSHYHTIDWTWCTTLLRRSSSYVTITKYNDSPLVYLQTEHTSTRYGNLIRGIKLSTENLCTVVELISLHVIITWKHRRAFIGLLQTWGGSEMRYIVGDYVMCPGFDSQLFLKIKCIPYFPTSS